MNTANRAWWSARFPIDIGTSGGNGTATGPMYFGKAATLVAVKEAEIECKLYTPRGSQVQNPRCCEFP